MSAFNLKTGKIVGNPSGKFWSQTHVFSPKDKEKKLLFGDLLAGLSFKAKKEEIDIASFGKEIISRFHEIYYSSQEKEVLARLKLSLKNLISEFAGQVELQVIAAVVIEKEGQLVGYFSLSDKGRVVILRDSQMVTLLKGTGEEIKTASGHLKDNDLFVLATSQFFEVASQGVLKASLESGQVFQTAESLASIVHAHKDNAQTAAVIFKTKVDLEDEVKKVDKVDKVGKVERKSVKDFLSAPVFFAKNFSFLARKFLKDFKEQPNVFIKDKGRKARAKKTTLSVALILIALLLASVVLGSKRKSVLKDSQIVQNVFEEADYKFQQALSLTELNPLRARSLLTEAKEIIKQAEEEIKEEKEKEKLRQLLDQIESELENTAKEYKIEKAELFLDLGLVKEGFKGDDWGFSEDYLQILDKETGTILEVEIIDKAAKVSAGGEKLDGAKKIGAASERIFVLKKKELLAVDKEKGEVVDEKEGKEWEEIVDLVGFGDNAYLLDVSQGKIFKYVKSGQGLSSSKNYFNVESFNLEGAISFAIDGSIWVLFSDGTIVKFTRGVKDAFSATGLGDGFNEPEKIYTDENLDNLYVLDRKNIRVVVINKDTGEYQAQYVWPGIAGALDIFASEEEKKIFLLMGERIYKIELK